MGKREFKESVPQHVYCRGKDGNIIFYCIEDCIFYITLYACLAEKHGITTHAFSLMPNHTHAQQYARNLASFLAFNGEMISRFTRTYNIRHDRSGALFDSPFGSVPKSVGKHIKGNISYICNNGAEGRLSKGVLDYRWNLVAYYRDKNPFSVRTRLNSASKRVRDAIKKVDFFRKRNKPLDYKAQDMIFKNLDKTARKQVIDYILTVYNFLDYDGMIMCFGSFEKAVAGMEANCGSEHDIKEDWDDYSVYSKLGKAVSGRGIDLLKVNFENMPWDSLSELRTWLKKAVGATDRQLDKFLHMTTRGAQRSGNQRETYSTPLGHR